MAPQTRNIAKSSPGRSTRNSVYGRSPLPPPKPRKSSTSPAQNAPAHNEEDNVTSNVSDTKGTPWLACRDTHGILTTVAVSETGEGVHVRWHYPEDEDVEMETSANEQRGVTPAHDAAGPSKVVRPPFPQTPIAPQPYNAGSVILTPVKKARPLQPSPARIGDKGIRCLYRKDGVLVDFTGRARIVLRHPVGSSANLSREQVERLEKEREDRIFKVQVEKLLADRKRKEEEECFSDSGYEDEMETDVPSFRRGLRREGTGDTIIISHDELSDAVSQVSLEEMERVSNVFRGPNGELLDRHGHQMLGHEGTILIDSTCTLPRRVMREEAFRQSTDFEDHSNNESDRCASEANRLHRPRFGPEGTELID